MYRDEIWIFHYFERRNEYAHLYMIIIHISLSYVKWESVHIFRRKAIEKDRNFEFIFYAFGWTPWQTIWMMSKHSHKLIAEAQIKKAGNSIVIREHKRLNIEI